MVDGEDVDGAPAVAQLPASSALKVSKSAICSYDLMGHIEEELTLAEFQPAIWAAPPTWGKRGMAPWVW